MDQGDQNPTTGNQQQEPMLDDGSVKASSFVEGIDMDAFNEVVDASKFTTTATNSNPYNVNDISLDNTPMSDEELNKQLENNPNMNLANTPSEISNPKKDLPPVPTPFERPQIDPEKDPPSISANMDRPEVKPVEKKVDPAQFDAPTVSTPIIAPSRNRLPLIILVVLLITTLVVLGYMLFSSGAITIPKMPWQMTE